MTGWSLTIAMKKSKFSESQIVFALQQAETGTAVAEVCRKLGSAKPRSTTGSKRKIRLFKEEYNGFRPHSSLSGLTPNEVVQQHSHGPIFSILGR
jgi:Transposase